MPEFTPYQPIRCRPNPLRPTLYQHSPPTFTLDAREAKDDSMVKEVPEMLHDMFCNCKTLAELDKIYKFYNSSASHSTEVLENIIKQLKDKIAIIRYDIDQHGLYESGTIMMDWTVSTIQALQRRIDTQ